jgi:hypothetical protein
MGTLKLTVILVLANSSVTVRIVIENTINANAKHFNPRRLTMDELGKILNTLANGALWAVRSDDTINGTQLKKLKAEAKAKLQAYCIEQRVDELKELSWSSSVTDEIKDYLWDNYIAARLKTLQSSIKDKDVSNG